MMKRTNTATQGMSMVMDPRFAPPRWRGLRRRRQECARRLLCWTGVALTCTTGDIMPRFISSNCFVTITPLPAQRVFASFSRRRHRRRSPPLAFTSPTLEYTSKTRYARSRRRHPPLLISPGASRVAAAVEHSRHPFLLRDPLRATPHRRRPRRLCLAEAQGQVEGHSPNQSSCG